MIGEAALAYVHEADLYPDIRETLETFWAKERQIEPLAVEISALAFATDGWSIPLNVMGSVAPDALMVVSQDLLNIAS
jgi:hypothetical protein